MQELALCGQHHKTQVSMSTTAARRWQLDMAHFTTYPTDQYTVREALSDCFTNSCNGWLVRMDHSTFLWTLFILRVTFMH